MRTYEEIKKSTAEHEEKIGIMDFDEFLEKEKELEEEMNSLLDAELDEED